MSCRLCGCSWGVIYAPLWPWPFPFHTAALSSCPKEVLRAGLWRECCAAQVGSAPWQWWSSISGKQQILLCKSLLSTALHGRSSRHLQADRLKWFIVFFHKRLLGALIALTSTEPRWEIHKDLPIVATETFQNLSRQNISHCQLISFILCLPSRGRDIFWQHLPLFSDVFPY